MQTVTEADLEPDGWVCDCGTCFLPGDLVFGVLIAVLPDGTVVEGDYRCIACWNADG